jgi:hypothetical protein
MPAGFQIINDSGVVQVDQDFKNYALYSKTTISSWSNSWNSGTGSSVYSASVSVPASGSYVVALVTDSTSYAAVMYGSTIMAYRSTSGFPSVTAYVFAAPGASGATSGLQVFDAAGEVAFDAALKYMRVAYAGPIPSRALPNDVPYTYSGLASGSYAVLQSFSRQRYVYSPGVPGSWQVWRDFYRSTATGFEVRNSGFAVGPGNASGFADQLTGGPVLLIDVSGL